MSEKTNTILDYQSYAPMDVPVDGDPSQNFFQRGSPVPYATGVGYFGPWETQGDGFNEHVRRCAKALSSVGCPVHLRAIHPKELGLPMGLDPAVRPLLEAKISRYSVQIYQAILSTSFVRALLNAGRFSLEERKAVNSRRIIYSVWERTGIDEGMVRALNSFGQVWTACTANADMLRTAGVDPDLVRVIPVPYFPDDPLLEKAHLAADAKLYGRPVARAGGVPRFYHIGKWEPRKAQDGLIASFMHAFTPKQASLILKTSLLRTEVQGYPQSPTDWIEHIIKYDPAVLSNGWTSANWRDSIEIVTGFLTNDQIVSLHKFGDIYVTAARAEGYDMPAMDAVISGNRVIYTKFGATRDFCTKDSDFPVKCAGTIPCSKLYQWESGARYMDYEPQDLTIAFKLAYAECMAGRYSRVSGIYGFDSDAVGMKMLQAIEELVGGPAYTATDEEPVQAPERVA